MGLLLGSQLLEKQADRLDPMREVRDMNLPVGSVQVVIGEAEAHHYARNFQSLVKVVDDRNRSAAADEDRFYLECIAQRLGGGLDVRIVRAHHAGRSFT